jgi:ATP-dependent helicase YprA (DUF1998 family)
MTDSYSLQNVTRELSSTLAQYLEAQYHIWDESLVRERRTLLAEPGVIAGSPYIESTPAYIPGARYSALRIPPSVSELLEDAAASGATGIPPIPYAHQADALEAFFGGDDDLVVSTGTGSGKTETFLMPILGSFAQERALRIASYQLPAVRALLLYPMNALVNDQIARLRRLLGAGSVANRLVRPDGFRATFGMYTSRTPYPGPFDLARTRTEVGGWINQFFVRYSQHRARLEAEGKWPAKDLAQFQQTFTTAPGDSELLTRHEMQLRPPDVLVTNYSMLEYMLLRPIDAPMFTRAQQWLAANADNKFVVVLDEAHLYQGAQGTEVALLLRRLVSRLRVPRERVRFILTSASLSGRPDAETLIQRFAAQLTGGPSSGEHFRVIRGRLNSPRGGRPANEVEAHAFAAVALEVINRSELDLDATRREARKLAESLGSGLARDLDSPIALRDALYDLVSRQPVAQLLTEQIMGRPMHVAALANAVFPTSSDPMAALDGLLAVCALARRAEDGRVFLPSRAHLLFRGLDGLFACVNPRCSQRRVEGPSILGRLYARARFRCGCGARVYELLTHRDCGAAYLRGYFRPNNPDFLWHEPSTGSAGTGSVLSEIHLLVEHARDQIGTSNQIWLHATTGRVERVQPASLDAFIELREPSTAAISIQGRPVVTYDRRCPVCRGQWRDRAKPKIMDLATKGEDPFAHLIAAQVRIQPPSQLESRATPNGGRKSLLFSDGRQKAARLARDVPRVIEQDAFRQTLLLAAQRLRELGTEARVTDSHLYVAFVSVVANRYLRFFDGADAAAMRSHESTFLRRYGGDLRRALADPWTPQAPLSFCVHVMRALGNPYYSLFALCLGYVAPRSLVFDSLTQDLAGHNLPEEDLRALSVVWLQGCLEEIALYATGRVTRRARELAAGYPITQAGCRSGFTRDQRRFLQNDINVAAFELAAQNNLTSPGDTPVVHLLNDDGLAIVPAVTDAWYRCQACTFLSPVAWRGRCAACGQLQLLRVPPGGDVYLHARKAFWRDPVERVLNGTSRPMCLDVEEHTAQLGYRDSGTLEATTEEYERRFRDILLNDEQAIDVLSCTTTMEVGIDIGSLIAIGLRNMPPSRHNYQQRAGRAGRRGAAVSTVVAYAQNNPHDSYLFDHPEELIASPARIVGLDVENPALVSRHVYAELLQEYFEDTVVVRRNSDVFAALGDTVPFFANTDDPSVPAFGTWLQTAPAAQETRERIRRWLPVGVGLTPESCAQELMARFQDLQPVARGTLPAGEERLIEFFFSRGILPAYAFPRDLVALQVDALDANRQVAVLERPQQGAAIALSEYAPGRLVVVNKRTYRVAAVTADVPSDTISRARPLFARPTLYMQCPNCLYTAEVGVVQQGARCPVCAAAQIAAITAIQPEVVWPQDRGPLDELDDDQITTDTTIAQLPVPASDQAFETQRHFGPTGRLSHGRQVPLIIMNRGELAPTGPTGFQVCDLCGYTALGGQPFVPRHPRHYNISARGQRIPPTCNGTARSVFLGYEFRTDVLLLRTPLSTPFINDLSDPETWPPLRAALTSLASGLALTAADALDVDPRELQSGFRLQRTATGAGFADIYLYDTLTGGAGYSRLIGQDFERIFDLTVSRLRQCTCDVSCTRCLRTYANRMSHTSLDRRLAIDLAEYSVRGLVPQLYSQTEQEASLAPIASMLSLDRWTVSPSPTVGIRAARGVRQYDVAAVPSLVDLVSLPNTYQNAIVFSMHEIEKDLPSCLLKLPT